MCLPKVIIHNSVSRDGAVNGIEVDLGLHYGTAGEYRADIHLIGSSTIISGLELYGTDIPAEEQSDFTKPKEKASLHYLGRAEYCRDVDVYSGKAFSFEVLSTMDKKSEQTHEGFLIDLQAFLRLCADKLDASLRY